MFMANFVNGQFFSGFRSFPKSFYSRTALLLRLTKSWNKKMNGGANIFGHKTRFLSSLNREFHIDLTADIAVERKSYKKRFLMNF